MKSLSVAQEDRERRSLLRDRVAGKGLVDPATVCRWARAAILSHPSARTISEDETDALMQEVVAAVAVKHGWNPPRDRVGRDYLYEIANGFLTGEGEHARGWRDSQGKYRTKRQEQRAKTTDGEAWQNYGDGPVLVALPDDSPSDDDVTEPGKRSVSQAALSRPGEPVPVLAWGAIPAADAAAREVLRTPHLKLTSTQREGVRIAFMAAGIAADGTRPGKALAVLARAAGMSPATAARRLDQGRAVLWTLGASEVRRFMRAGIAASPIAREPDRYGRPVWDGDTAASVEACDWLIRQARLSGLAQIRRSRARTIPASYAYCATGANRRTDPATGRIPVARVPDWNHAAADAGDRDAYWGKRARVWHATYRAVIGEGAPSDVAGDRANRAAAAVERH